MRLKFLVSLLFLASTVYGLDVKGPPGITSTDATATYVQKAGDTMTGTLTNKPGSAVTGLFINQDNNAKSLEIDSEATGAVGTNGILMSFQHTADNVVQISNNSPTGHLGGALMYLKEDHTSSTALVIDAIHDGSGNVAEFDNTASTGTLYMNGALGGAIMFRDTDDAGCTIVTTLNGTGTFFQDTNCDRIPD